MTNEISLIVSLASFLLSVFALLRRGRIGATGLQGPQGDRGIQGVPGPQARPVLGADSNICESCGKQVARFSQTPAGLLCANCHPIK